MKDDDLFTRDYFMYIAEKEGCPTLTLEEDACYEHSLAWMQDYPSPVPSLGGLKTWVHHNQRHTSAIPDGYNVSYVRVKLSVVERLPDETE